MKKGLQIAILIVLCLILVALVWLGLNERVWIIEGLNGTDGEDGQDGQSGKSAYELACENGFEGTLHEWLVSLAVKGEDGEKGSDGQNGVSVRDVRVGIDGNLFVTLTNGVVLNAGRVTAPESTTDEPDAEGFSPVYEMVTVENCTALNLREGPGSNYPSVEVVSVGTELLRIGVNESLGSVGWSRVVYEKDGVPTVCYASSYYLNLKYIYDGTLPTILLPDSMTLTVGETLQLVYAQILPDPISELRPRFAWSGTGERIYDGDDAFLLTPDTVGEGTLTFTLELWARDAWRVAYRKEIAVRVLASPTTETAHAIIIGDRMATDGAFLAALTQAMPGLTLSGSQSTNGARHEGYIGGSAAELTASATVGGRHNPFYRSAAGAFDLSYYLSNTGIAELDTVILAFEDARASNAADILALAQAIRETSTDIEVIILTSPIAPADGYYLTSTADLSIEETRALQAHRVAALFETFEAPQEGITLLPVHLAVNDLTDRQCAEVNGQTRVTDLLALSAKGQARIAALIVAELCERAVA